MNNLLKIDFQIIGSPIPPKEISKLLCIKPDVALLKGERNKELCLPRNNLWAVESKVKSEELEDHWKDIKLELEKATQEIKKLSNFNTIIKISIVIQGNRIPSITIPPDLSRFAGDVNASIDVDHLQS